MSEAHEEERAEEPVVVVTDNTPQTRALTAAIVLGVVGVCVLVGAMVNAQAGTLLLAGASFAGAALRMSLPAGQSFSVRRRAVDISLMVVFGLVLAFLGLTTPLG